MSRYFQAMERRKTGLVPYADPRTRPLAEVVPRSQPMALVPVLEAQGLLDALAASRSIRNLSEQLGAAKNAVIARSDEKDNESTEIQETRYQRRNRAKQEKALRESVARKAEANAA